MAKGWVKKQKERGVKLVLTWFHARQCWKKYRGGKTKYFHHPNSAAGYEAAVAEYHAWVHEAQDRRTFAAEYHQHINQLGKCLEWYNRFGVPEDELQLQPEIAKLVARLEGALAADDELLNPALLLPDGACAGEKELILSLCSGSDRFGSPFWAPSGPWQERIRQLEGLESRHKKLPQTIEYQTQRFLDFKEMQARNGVITARTWGTIAERLPHFSNWIKPGTHVSTIDGTTLAGFYEWVLSQHSWGHQRSKNVFNTARQWIRWAWRQDDVELEHLPRNIDSREFVFLTHMDRTGVTKKTRTEKLWTRSEFTDTLARVPEDFQLFLLLMLNCGFTNSDVAALLKSEIKLNEGRIVRQRTKTRRHAHPPVVNYKLWPTTLRLLTKHWSSHPTLALTNQRGNPLAVSRLSSGGGNTRETVWTSIGRRFEQMKKAKSTKKKQPLPNKQLKFLRKTGSSKLRSRREFTHLDSLYLGHSWTTVADRHYNAFDGEPFAPLDEAIDWLGDEFGQRE